MDGSVVISSDQFIVARVPDGAARGEVVVATNGSKSNPSEVHVAVPIAENLHPVANPAIDEEGNIYVTFSGSRGQKVPVAIYRIDNNYNVKPFVHEMMNATGMAFDRAGSLYVSSRYDGTVYRVAQNGTMTSYAEGMGVATGIAFDRDGNLYVGDRSGTIFKIDRDRQIFVFAMLEPSVSAYHLAFGSNGNLYVSRPDYFEFRPHLPDRSRMARSAFSTADWDVRRGWLLTWTTTCMLRPRSMAAGASCKITPDGQASLAVSGHNLVGLAFAPAASAVLATTSGVHHLSWGIEGRSLLPEV